MAISGENRPGKGDRRYELWEEEGTTYLRFIEFFQRILDEIGPGTPERRRCVMMDNLNAHTNPTVTAMILDAGHQILFRTPYYPVDGPIEYVFNTFQNLLCILMRFTVFQCFVNEVDCCLLVLFCFLFPINVCIAYTRLSFCLFGHD